MFDVGGKLFRTNQKKRAQSVFDFEVLKYVCWVWYILQTVLQHRMFCLGHLLSEPFWKLPSKRYYPDYYKEIKNPVSLSQIRNKLKVSVESYITKYLLTCQLKFLSLWLCRFVFISVVEWSDLELFQLPGLLKYFHFGFVVNDICLSFVNYICDDIPLCVLLQWNSCKLTLLKDQLCFRH